MGQRIRQIRSASAAFNSYFLNNFFSKEIRCIVSNGSFTFFLNYCHQNFISFDVRSFLTKLLQFASSFFTRLFFWLKIFFDENFDDMNNFFKNFTKVVFCSKNAKWSLNLTRFCVSKAENSDDQQRKNYEFSSFQVAKMSVTNPKIIVT